MNEPEQPSHLVKFRRPLTAEQVETFKRQFAAALKTQQTVIYDLPWRTRLRWIARHGIDATGIWLCDHHRPELAMLLWKACRMW